MNQEKRCEHESYDLVHCLGCYNRGAMIRHGERCDCPCHINRFKPKDSVELSNCCKSPVRVDTADEGTSCYMCSKCGKPCDVAIKDIAENEARKCLHENCVDWKQRPDIVDSIATALRKAKADGRREENEACAEIAESHIYDNEYDDGNCNNLSSQIASEIRQRMGGKE